MVDKIKNSDRRAQSSDTKKAKSKVTKKGSAEKESKLESKKSAKLVAEPKAEKPVVDEAKPEAVAKKAIAKAGKRSAKAIAETEVKAVKEARKASKAEAEEKPKVQAKPPRTRFERAGKKYREVAKLIEANKVYSLSEAIDLVTKTNPAKFDAAVEMHLNLGVDPTQADQNIRGVISLPAGTGKSVRVAVFADEAEAKKAESAGADIAGSDKLGALLEKGEVNFDILIATPTLMPQLGKYAKLLGPKGLMPNPKSGTVTANTASAVKEAKAGRLEYRVDSVGIVHVAIGKVSFGPEKLLSNAEALMTTIRSAKPGSVKGVYIKTISVSTTMGPGIKTEAA